MSVTVSDLLKLPCLEDAKVIAGAAGLKEIVSSVSVLEYAEPTHLQQEFFERNKIFLGGELVITGFISIKDNIQAQCESIIRMHEAGDVAVILYYVGVILPIIDQRLVNLADSLNFPLISMPARLELRYSEVISEVMEQIFKDQSKQKYFVGEMIERISRLTISQRTLANVLRMLSDRMRCSMVLCDTQYRMLDKAPWPMMASEYLKNVLDAYQSGFSHESSEMRLRNGKVLNVACLQITTDRQTLFQLVFQSEKKIDTEQMKQSIEVIRLFFNIWSKKNGNLENLELIRSILQDEPIKMRRLADMMHINIAAFHSLWFLSLKKGTSIPDSRKAKAYEAVLSAVREYFTRQKVHFIADIFEGQVIVFYADLSISEEFNTFIHTFIDENKMADKVVLFYQTGIENTTVVHDIFRLYQKYINEAQTIYSEANFLTHRELQFVKKCFDLIEQGEEKVKEGLTPLSVLIDCDKDEVLLSTLSVYLLEANQRITETASLLYVHKNTVKYRLHKIEELLDYSILKMPELIQLYQAVAIQRILDKK